MRDPILTQARNFAGQDTCQQLLHVRLRGYSGFCLVALIYVRKEKIDILSLHTSLNYMNTRYITAKDGSRTDVVLPVADYEALMEDLQDLAVIAERREEPTYSLEEVKERLKADGLL